MLKQVDQWVKNFIWTVDILKQGLATVNWSKICASNNEGSLKVTNLHIENNAYLLKLAWNFAYSKEPWTLLKARFHIYKYHMIIIYSSFSICSEIKDLSDLVLEHTSWIVGSSIDIIFWNDLWCSSRWISLIASVPYIDRLKLSSKVS